jgi:hypothetical protein
MYLVKPLRWLEFCALLNCQIRWSFEAKNGQATGWLVLV